MERVCKNCQHFKPFEEEKEKGFGECSCPKFKYESAYDWKERKITKDSLLYMDYEWYRAYIDVGEEFGCIHFKEGEKNDKE